MSALHGTRVEDSRPAGAKSSLQSATCFGGVRLGLHGSALDCWLSSPGRHVRRLGESCPTGDRFLRRILPRAVQRRCEWRAIARTFRQLLHVARAALDCRHTRTNKEETWPHPLARLLPFGEWCGVEQSRFSLNLAQ